MSTFSPERKQPAVARWSMLVNTAIVAGGYLLSRVLGLVRDVIISWQFGTSPELDAYRAAFAIPDLIYIVVAGGALGSAFIPVFAGLLEAERSDDAWRLASTLANLALAALLVTSLLIAIFAGPLVALTVGNGFDADKRALTVQLVRLLLLQPIFLGLGGLAKATLESFDRFTLPAIGSNLYNLGIIAGAIVLAPWLGVYGLVWGVIGGAALFVLVQVPGLVAVGARYVPAFYLSAPGVARVGQLLGPRLFGQSAWQVNLIAIASFASTLGSGAVAANAYALQLMMLPHGLIALSLGTVIFPRLSRAYALGDQAELRATALGALRSVIFLALPAAVLLAVLRWPILRVLFQRGAFDTLSAALTAEAVLFYALGLTAFAAAEIAVRAFYAMQDTRTPVIVGAVVVVTNIGLIWVLLRAGLGLGGLALGFSLSTTLELVVLLVLLQRRIGGFGASFWPAFWRMLAAALACGLVMLLALRESARFWPALQPGDTYIWPVDFVPMLAWLAAALAVGAAVYAVVAAFLGVPEVRTTLDRARSMVRRRE